MEVVEAGYNVAVIENHNGDSLANVYSNARNSFYGITGYPTVKFDGVLEIVGGYAGWSADAIPLVETRNAIPSDFTIDIEFEETDGDYHAIVTTENVGGNTSTNLVLQFTITESKLPIVWGFTEVQDFVNRLMVPDQNGTALDFSGSNTQVVELDFNSSYWDVSNCDMIAFIQDNTTKEIKQGTIKTMAIAMHDIDAEAKAVIFPTGTFCGVTNFEEPIVQIKNMGSENLTSLDIEYSINGGATQSYAWTGDLGFNLGEQVVLPGIDFTPAGTNTFEFTVSNPNGEVDPNPENNTTSGEFYDAYVIGTEEVLLELKTDQYPAETTWQLQDENGNTLYSGGPYSAQLTVYNETFTIDADGCYEFIIYDSYGDGICCDYGDGYYKLLDGDMTEFFAGGDFASEEATPFSKGGAPPPAGPCEEFDAIAAGGLVAEQLGGMWTTWSGTTADDATVSDMYSNSPDNSFVVDAGTVDLVRKFDDVAIDAGQWLYSNYIYVPTGFSGYFNVQSDPTPGVAWVVDLFFDDGGTGSFGTSATSTFEYAQDTWIFVEINFDLDADFVEVYFDGALMTVFAWDGTIGGIDYYGYDVGGTPGAYYDGVCFDEGWVYTGIEDQLVNDHSTQLYPNPATDLVNITSEYNMNSITIYNFAGQVVLTEAVNNTTYRVNTSDFNTGIYLFQIETQEGRISKRVVIE